MTTKFVKQTLPIHLLAPSEASIDHCCNCCIEEGAQVLQDSMGDNTREPGADIPEPSNTGRVITLKECQQHVREDDCWLIINGKVLVTLPSAYAAQKLTRVLSAVLVLLTARLPAAFLDVCSSHVLP